MSARNTNVVIRASAGSGKTHALATRFLGLLLAGTRPDEILATTFTRKAAGEILERVLHRLAKLATEESARRELAEELQIEPPTAGRCRQLLSQTLKSLHQMRVGTLDSFFAQLAGGYGLELGLPPGWSIAEPVTEDALRDEAIERLLAEDRLADLLELLHLLTKGEARRGLGQLIRDTVKNVHELYQDAPPAAWQRIPRLPSVPAAEVAAAVAGLRTVAVPDHKGFEKEFDKLLAAAAAGDWLAFVSHGLSSKVLEGEAKYYSREIPPDLAAACQLLCRHAKAHFTQQLASQTTSAWKLLDRFHGQYQRVKQERRRLAFNDVTRALCELHHLAEADALAFRLDGSIRHLLLDEFQDTSLPQWQVLRPFAQRVTEGSGSLFCVGDVKQAIYGWRGGVADIFDAINHELPNIAGDSLAKSWRSSPPVIAMVNRLFSNLLNHDRLEKQREGVERWVQGFETHLTAKTDLAGYACLRTCPPPEKDEEGKPNPDAVLRYTAKLVAQQTQQAPGRTIGVLLRSNAKVARMIFLLREEGVPASEEGGNPLIDSAPVELLVSLLKLVDHPGDTIAAFHVAASPLGKAIDLAAHNQPRRSAQLARDLARRLLDEGYKPVVYELAKKLAPHCNARDLNRLQQLVDLAWQYQPQSTLRTSDFVRLIEEQRVGDPTTDLVRVMTVHQAKGLEFDCVYLPELQGNLVGQPDKFVTRRSDPTAPPDYVCHYANKDLQAILPAELQEVFDDQARQDISEALCVLYVATTRAIHSLQMVVLPSENGALRTTAGLIRAALVGDQPLPPESICVEEGDPQWYLSTPREAASEAPRDELPLKLTLAPPLATRQRGLERVRPSGLEGGTRLRFDDLFRSQHSFAAQRGTLFHAWFERIVWLDDGVPSDADLRAIAAKLAAEIGDVGDKLDALIAQFRAALGKRSINAVLRQDHYQPVWGEQLHVQNERPFAVALDGEIMSGTIDRLVTLTRGDELLLADILDFKTDDLKPGDADALQAKIDYYALQVRAYRRAVAAWTGLTSDLVTSHLIFTALGKIVVIS